MRFIADFHIHSRFSRATSRSLTLAALDSGARRKGLAVLGTGDATHPEWLAECAAELTECGPGVYRRGRDGATRFLFTAEVSSIYKQGGRVRKVHNVLFLSALERAQAFSRRLARVGNIASDGRPILGLSAHDLLALLLEVDPEGFLVPAHIWTPWFSLLGAQSGFDHLEECFGDLAPEVFAAETGLSSDPPMNWRISWLDRLTLISNSDAHSAEKLAREANRFDCEPDFPTIKRALATRQGFLGTLEFFPEEGKYHVDGHRKCGVRLTPAETIRLKGLCPVCGKPVTVGVLHRVAELADRPEGTRPESAADFRSIVPLDELVGEALGVGAASNKVQAAVTRLVTELGSELNVLLETPAADIARVAGPVAAEAIRRMRAGEVRLDAGYDGEFGTIHLFDPGEREKLLGQVALLPEEAGAPKRRGRKPKTAATAEPVAPPRITLPTQQQPNEQRTDLFSFAGLEIDRPVDPLAGLDDAQRRVAVHRGGPLRVIAGPGSGKTRALTARAALLLSRGEAKPEELTVVTFTRRAAGELRERLLALCGDQARKLTVATFHAFGAQLLRRWHEPAGLPADFTILAEEERPEFLAATFPDIAARSRAKLGREVERRKRTLAAPDAPEADSTATGNRERYDTALRARGFVDYEDLLLLPCRLLDSHPELATEVRRGCRHLLVDEYQDVSPVQVELLRRLSPTGDGLVVIGDADQAIYGFRGADPAELGRFGERWPGATTLTLATNYRSSTMIVQAAASVIARNPGRELLALRAQSPDNRKVVIRACPSDQAEAVFVSRTIERLLGGTSHRSFESGGVESWTGAEACSFGDFAVLVRTHDQGELLAQTLARAGLPTRGIGAVAWREREEVRAWLKAIRLVAGRRALIPGAGPALAPLLPFVETLGPHADARLAVARIELALGWNAAGCPAHEAIPELLAGAEPAETLAGMLDRLMLAAEADRLADRADKIALLTLHAAKGLEWPVVFLCGCEAGLMPLTLPGVGGGIEEERRLFYVGLTRARALAFLTYAKSRAVRSGKLTTGGPSPFLGEIDERFREEQRERLRKEKQLTLF